MTGNLHIGNKKSLTCPIQPNDTDAANKAYIDDNLLKLSGGTLSRDVTVPDPLTGTVYGKRVLNYSSILYFLVEKSTPYVSTRLNVVNHKIINLAHPTGDKDAVNKQYFKQEVQKSHIKPSHKTTQFAYLMQNNLE